jgi:hypothetical protein
VLGGAIDDSDPARLRQAQLGEIERVAAGARGVERRVGPRRDHRPQARTAGWRLGPAIGLAPERVPALAVLAHQHLRRLDERGLARLERVLEHDEVRPGAIGGPRRGKVQGDRSTAAERGHVGAAHVDAPALRGAQHDPRQRIVPERDPWCGLECLHAIGVGIGRRSVIVARALDRLVPRSVLVVTAEIVAGGRLGAGRHAHHDEDRPHPSRTNECTSLHGIATML